MFLFSLVTHYFNYTILWCNSFSRIKSVLDCFEKCAVFFLSYPREKRWSGLLERESAGSWSLARRRDQFIPPNGLDPPLIHTPAHLYPFDVLYLVERRRNAVCIPYTACGNAKMKTSEENFRWSHSARCNQLATNQRQKSRSFIYDSRAQIVAKFQKENTTWSVTYSTCPFQLAPVHTRHICVENVKLNDYISQYVVCKMFWLRYFTVLAPRWPRIWSSQSSRLWWEWSSEMKAVTVRIILLLFVCVAGVLSQCVCYNEDRNAIVHASNGTKNCLCDGSFGASELLGRNDSKVGKL